MNMKYLAAMVLATGLVSAAHAATYNVLGTQSYSIDAITSSPEEGGLGGVLTQTPNPPTFSGSWNVDPTASVSGGVVFAPYGINLDLPGLGTIDLSVPGRVLAINGGNFSYDAATRTLTGSNIGFLESSPGATCTDSNEGLLCAFLPGPDAPSHVSLTLTFSADFLSFNGLLDVHQEIAFFAPDPATSCMGEGGSNVCTNNLLTFSGVAEVPVPAAAWLFGSGLLGMATMVRRKAA